MATSSYNRPVTLNPDWGVQNLLKAMKKGDQLRSITQEDIDRSNANLNKPFTAEEIQRIRNKYKK